MSKRRWLQHQPLLQPNPDLPGHPLVAPEGPKAFSTNPQPRYLEHVGDVELGGRDPDREVDEHHDDNGEEHSEVAHCGSDLGRETGAERGQTRDGKPGDTHNAWTGQSLKSHHSKDMLPWVDIAAVVEIWGSGVGQ